MAKKRRLSGAVQTGSKSHIDEAIQRIDVVKLIERLQAFALSTEKNGVLVDQRERFVPSMTILQVKVSIALLNKALPHPQNIELHDGAHSYVIRAPAVVEDTEKWLRMYAPADRKQVAEGLD